jgi:hypothetical protein
VPYAAPSAASPLMLHPTHEQLEERIRLTGLAVLGDSLATDRVARRDVASGGKLRSPFGLAARAANPKVLLFDGGALWRAPRGATYGGM